MRGGEGERRGGERRGRRRGGERRGRRRGGEGTAVCHFTLDMSVRPLAADGGISPGFTSPKC